jgi:hypothetical protein
MTEVLTNGIYQQKSMKWANAKLKKLSGNICG